ncbi:M1 family metallopeptidase [Agromyces endophyticus]|uniref:M1 family metallopeptidase n=1 Tax=Agromyces sp. H17E-10 TaxID=2932244 RepID=UPI001FD59E8A|nr:M1 family metallopeptidase [Agromyces sp. H17E-10]UOQ88653.1 M1 family metallopeptidase [Agromyces sp. H17E-10]
MSHRRTMLAALSAAGLALAVVAAPAVATAAPGKPGQPRYSAGADGAGDPYFPLAGNGGIDLQHIDLDLDYTPPAPEPAPLEGQLDGVATIDLRATQDLDRFNLDLRGLTVHRVTVGGKPMAFTQTENELVITPRPKLKAGQGSQVVVEYGGTTTQPRDIDDELYGWVTTRDGAMVVSEPDGAATWFPVSDHPSDKASYDFEITVPDGLVAVANGTLADQSTNDGRTTWTWHAPDQMAAYLATASVGDYTLNRYTTPDGLEIIDAVDPALPASASASLALAPEMIAFFEDRFGPYPFVAYGAIVDDDSVGYALETQTRSFFSRRASEGTAAHELAHQWMGDQVSPGRWADIWLNEGWASYASWMWSEEQGRATAQTNFDEVMSTPADDEFWSLVVADPQPHGLFAGAVYDRGAATLHALRVKIGDDAFFELAKEWVERFGGGTATTADFTALAEEVSGTQLDAFFQTWLYAPEKPTTW